MRIRIDNLPHIEPTDFVGGIFPKRQLSIIASEPGCGKTWLMLRFCNDITNQYNYCKFLGQSFIEKDRRCLMLIGDTGKEMIIDRINNMVLKYNKPENYIFYFVADMIREKHPFLLNTEAGRGAIQGLIHQEKPDIIFFDTLISFMTGDENSAKEIGELFIGLRSMAEEENCAIVLNHHFRKQNSGKGSRGKATLNDVIGSSAMSRLSSVMLALTKDRTRIDKNIVNVSTVKTWYKELPPMQFEISENSEHKVDLIPNYTMNNVLALRKMLLRLNEQLPEGQIVTYHEMSVITNSPEPLVRAALKGVVVYTPLTEDPKCDRVYVTKSRKGESDGSNKTT